MLFEWTQMPASQVVTTLCDVPYSEAGGKISFEIPANLGRNSTYTIVIVAGTWGHNDEYFSATMTDYKVTCDDDGFIPITTKNGTYDYVPTADDSGHKLIAIVSWRNKYYTISERVSNPIDVK